MFEQLSEAVIEKLNILKYEEMVELNHTKVRHML
jgi:hypothetical protein